MRFDHTEQGKINRYLFCQDPLVWVEGVSDIPFYGHALAAGSCTILAAEGKSECIKLADAIKKHDLPYVVIMDGDYGILERRKPDHRWVVHLDRNSIENYLFEKDLVQHVCLGYVRLKTQPGLGNTTEADRLEKLIGDSFDRLTLDVEARLRELVILDIANVRQATGCAVLPDRVDCLCRPGNGVSFIEDCIAGCRTKGKSEVNSKEIADATDLLSCCLKSKRFIHIIPGHLAYGILRRFVKSNVRLHTGKGINIDDEGLMLLLSSRVWTAATHSDHKKLKRRLRRALCEVKAARQNR